METKCGGLGFCLVGWLFNCGDTSSTQKSWKSGLTVSIGAVHPQNFCQDCNLELCVLIKICKWVLKREETSGPIQPEMLLQFCMVPEPNGSKICYKRG